VKLRSQRFLIHRRILDAETKEDSMHSFRQALILLIAVLTAEISVTALSYAQQAKEAKEPAGSIAGQVDVDGKPARNVSVLLLAAESRPQQPLIARTVTDEEGNFKLTRIAAGIYTIQAFNPALTATADQTFGWYGKSVILSDGEEVEGVNIQLLRGGVITGRVTDQDGNPLIEARVALLRIDQRGQREQFYLPHISSILQTDDRGVYRIYGLPAGRYIVAAGQGNESIVARNAAHPRTYYPDTTDESLAKIIEVASGSEQSDIDIVIGRPLKTFTATGRIIDAMNRRPVANVIYGIATGMTESGAFSNFTTFSNRSNSNGEFRIEGLIPGSYAAIARVEAPSDLYAEPSQFVIIDSDVSGLVIKLHRGTSLSGQLLIEGMSEKQAAPLITEFQVNASVESPERVFGGMTTSSRVEPDGSFFIAGLPAGRTRLGVIRFPRGVWVAPRRIEIEGTDYFEGLDVTAGKHLSGVKVFIAYGTGRIRGQVKIEGGELPDGARIHVSAQNLDGGNQRGGHSTIVDVRGNFIIRDLAPGEYELNASVYDHARNRARTRPVKQKVTVSNDEETPVTITLELTEIRNSRQ
jgi:protocatechuate 3,4-dioxygenase beta subunit